MDQSSSNWQNCLEYAALSDVGLRRANNQDAMALVLASNAETWQQRGHLFLVADGMGAHAAGELASKLASDMVSLTYSKRLDLPPMEAIRSATLEANAHIHSRGQASDDFRGMGTTCTTLLLLPTGALVAHVGDSRTYRLRGDRLEQLTRDHSLVWEIRAIGKGGAAEVPGYIPRNIITRSLGPNPAVQVDLEGPFPIQVGDAYLLCSDGLSGQIQDKEIGALLASMPPKEAVEALVELAKLRGGPDNISVITVRVVAPLPPPADEPVAAASVDRPGGNSIPPLVWILLAVFGVAAAAAALREQWEAMALCLVGVVATSVAAIVQSLRRGPAEPRSDEAPVGGGPYVATLCKPDDDIAGELAAITEQLRDAATEEQWAVDWPQFDARIDRARTARQAAHYDQAIRHYCGAVTFMMGQLKNQPSPRDHGNPPGK